MRHSPQRFLRAAVVLLLLQGTFGGALVPHVRGPRSEAAHVEAAGATSCPVLHDDGHCLVCQAMSLRVMGTQPARLRIPEIITGTGLARVSPRSQPLATRSPRHPRAPPVV